MLDTMKDRPGACALAIRHRGLIQKPLDALHVLVALIRRRRAGGFP